MTRPRTASIQPQYWRLVVGLVLIAGLLAVCTGSALAQDTGSEPATFNVTITSDGEPQSLGIPGPTNQTLAELFPSGTDGITAVFAHEDDSWQLVTDLDRPIEPLEAFALSTTKTGPDTVPVRISVTDSGREQGKTVEEGWIFTAGRVADTPVGAFGTDADLLLQLFGVPGGPDIHTHPPIGQHVVGSEAWTGEAPTLTPFGGYFVHFRNGTTVTSPLSNASTEADALAQLGLARLEGTVVTNPTIDAIDELPLAVSAGEAIHTATTPAPDGSYEVSVPTNETYELTVSAPGIGPNANGTSETVAVGTPTTEQNLSLEWLETTNLYIDGGSVTLPGDSGSAIPATELPGCEQQANGSWEPEPIDPNLTNGSMDISFDPADECYRIDNVSIDPLTGDLTIDEEQLTLPTITVYTEELGDLGTFADSLEFEIEFLVDEIDGTADLRTGAATIDLDMRLLIGGTVNTIFSVPFGSRGGYNDCQISDGWGGNVSDPQADTADDQIGDYRHDPLQLTLSTGTSGTISGTPYDPANGTIGVAEGLVTAGRLSEGSFGVDDPGGAACGEIGFGIDMDIASVINDMLGLPSSPGDMQFELAIVAGDDETGSPIP